LRKFYYFYSWCKIKPIIFALPNRKENDLERSGKRVLGNAGKRGCRDDDLSRLGHQKKSFKKIFEIVLEIKKRILLLPHFSPKKLRWEAKRKRNEFIEDIKKVRRRASK